MNIVYLIPCIIIAVATHAIAYELGRTSVLQDILRKLKERDNGKAS